jgi:hypothetical protein
LRTYVQGLACRVAAAALLVLAVMGMALLALAGKPAVGIAAGAVAMGLAGLAELEGRQAVRRAGEPRRR